MIGVGSSVTCQLASSLPLSVSRAAPCLSMEGNEVPVLFHNWRGANDNRAAIQKLISPVAVGFHCSRSDWDISEHLYPITLSRTT